MTINRRHFIGAGAHGGAEVAGTGGKIRASIATQITFATLP